MRIIFILFIIFTTFIISFYLGQISKECNCPRLIFERPEYFSKNMPSNTAAVDIRCDLKLQCDGKNLVKMPLIEDINTSECYVTVTNNSRWC